jgi:hypothetical protein
MDILIEGKDKELGERVNENTFLRQTFEAQ